MWVLCFYFGSFTKPFAVTDKQLLIQLRKEFDLFKKETGEKRQRKKTRFESFLLFQGLRAICQLDKTGHKGL
ncbi:hypothetical protein MNBD_BACTEROID03-440 [hydrothermal vent metagenome]|uniref:Uncharacterized protein n=1 Tax=hydrothermal vent metagenome TaxID=652676 RepID=A0A3B0SUH4_9ZZZZ